MGPRGAVRSRFEGARDPWLTRGLWLYIDEYFVRQMEGAHIHSCVSDRVALTYRR